MSMLQELIAGVGGIPSLFTKDTPMGTRDGGPIVDVQVRQARDFESGEPQFWENGDPMQQVAIIVQTNHRDPAKPDDDGKRGIYVKWWGDQRKDLVDAVKAAGDDDVRPGGQFYITFTGERPNEKNPRLNNTKLYKFEYVRPATGLDFTALGQEPAAAAPAAAAPAPVAAAPAPVAVPNAQAAIAAANAAGYGAAVAAAPAPAPVAAAPAAALSAAVNPIDQIRMFLSLGMTDADIAAATGQAIAVVTAVRNAPPA